MADTPTRNRNTKRTKGQNNHDFLTVGIGASAGGIGALERLFERMPADSGMAFVVILHLSPEHESNLAALIQKWTEMPVIKVTERIKVEPNRVYVIPPAKHLVMTDGHVTLHEPEMKAGMRIPVDLFFRTLAGAYDVKSVGVVLSGTGTDGTLGLRHIKEAGGVSIAQDPAQAEHDGMPRSAINSGMVDFVLPVESIPEKLLALRQLSERIQTPPETGEPLKEDDEEALRQVLAILRARTGNDFTSYKRSTVLRRITRRLQVNAVEDIGTYAALLRERPSEAQELLGDMIISVTNFFRDSEAFKALEQEVVPRLFENKEVGDQVRVWVSGCATGDEAYSLVILLLEHAERLSRPPSIQVFATDIDQDSMNGAREGLFPESISADVSPERLKRFFTRENEYYRVKKEVREAVLFAPHNILRDPPFSRLDLISCRNVLIYLNRETQERVLELFHFALNPEGYLFLGVSESADTAADLFTPVDKKLRVFRRRAIASAMPYIPSLPAPGRWEVKPVERASGSPKIASFGDLHYQLLENYAPPSVLVNTEYDIVHLSETAGRFLRFTGGEPSRNLIKAVHPDLRLELRSALLGVAQGKDSGEIRQARIELDGQSRLVKVHVHRPNRPDAAQGFLLVIFEEVEPPGDAPLAGHPGAATSGEALEPVVRQFEDELQRTKTQLRSTIEQYETTTEELRASNEELQAINEELRSTTEELETGKEELQSLNEEMRTVNHELKEKVDELGRANADLQNLLAATDIATIFLDRDLRIKRYTPSVQQLFNIIPSDTARPLAHVTHGLEYDGMTEDAARTLETLDRVEREVRSNDGRYYIARLIPYRTPEDRIDGVVLSFFDITGRKLAEDERNRLHEELMKERALMDAVVRQMPAGILIAEADTGKMVFANEQADRIWRATLEKPAGDEHYSEYPGYHMDGRRYALEEWPMWRSINQGEIIYNEEIKMRREDGSWGLFNTSSSPVRNSSGQIVAGVVTFYDTTEERATEISLRHSQERLRLIVESIEDYAIITLDPQGRIQSWNPGAEKTFGYTEGEVIGQSGGIIFTPEDRAAGVPEKEIETALSQGRADDERWHVRKDGSRFFASGVMAAMRDGDLLGCVKVMRDLTARKQMEEELRRSRDEMEQRVRERTQEIEMGYEALEVEMKERRASDERVKELLRRVVNTQELERRRIARDLHDQLGQQLTALRLSLESLKEQCEDRASLREQVEHLQAAAEQIDGDVDFLAWELRPSTLDELGLAATVESFVHEWSKQFGIPADFHTAGLAGTRLPTEAEINLYRIAQEALNNVYKHAEAGRAGVILERRENHAVLIVEDDGKGFDPNEVTNMGRGLGLVSMRERASLTGGELEIQSAPGQGTTVFLRVPIGLTEEGRRKQ
jgi:two-component system, chemotaxis family, CheB/CheR fusion protein